MVEADGGGDDGIGRGEHPAKNRDEMHTVKHHSVADGQTLVLADIGVCRGRGEVMPLTAVIEHGKPIIIALHKYADDGGDPAYDGYEGEDKETYDIYGLPKAVAEGQADASAHIAQDLVGLEMVFLAIDLDRIFRRCRWIGNKITGLWINNEPTKHELRSALHQRICFIT